MQARDQSVVRHHDAQIESRKVSFFFFPSLSNNLATSTNNITSTCTFDPN